MKGLFLKQSVLKTSYLQESPINTIPGWWLGHPSQKYKSQLGWLATQYVGKCQKWQPNHQPVYWLYHWRSLWSLFSHQYRSWLRGPDLVSRIWTPCGRKSPFVHRVMKDLHMRGFQKWGYPGYPKKWLVYNRKSSYNKISYILFLSFYIFFVNY